MPRRARLESVDQAVPVRTCVGCRSRAAQADLLRLVVNDRVVLPDPARRMPGRGAYLHPDTQCRDQAERRRAWRRAFKVQGELDTSRVAECLAAAAHVGVGPEAG